MPSNPNVIAFVPPASDDAIALAAAAWVVAKDRGLDPSEMKALSDWLAEDPRHTAEFARIANDWGKLESLAAVPDMASQADAIEARYLRRARNRRLSVAFAATAAAAAVAMLVWRGARTETAPAVAADKGYVILASTARQQPLPDGSVAELNGDSQIATDFVPAERRVKLIRGEAHFIVAKNPARPFLVTAGTVTVRAVGTAFIVRLTPATVEVLVTEGKVHVWDAPATGARKDPAGAQPADPNRGQSLAVNERAIVRLNTGGKISVTVDRPAPVEFDEALAWKSTRLVFDHTPMDQVVSAFNRYNSHKLILADPQLRTRTLTGIFRTDNLDGFTRLLPASVDIIAVGDGNGRTLLRGSP